MYVTVGVMVITAIIHSRLELNIGSCLLLSLHASTKYMTHMSTPKSHLFRLLVRGELSTVACVIICITVSLTIYVTRGVTVGTSGHATPA